MYDGPGLRVGDDAPGRSRCCDAGARAPVVHNQRSVLVMTITVYPSRYFAYYGNGSCPRSPLVVPTCKRGCCLASDMLPQRQILTGAFWMKRASHLRKDD